MKQSETAAIGCLIGLCSLVSPLCNFFRTVLANFHGGRGAERRSEGASRRRKCPPDKRREEQRTGGR